MFIQKQELARSKKLEKIIFSGDDKEMRKLFRFKEFSLSEGSVKPRKMKLGNVVGRMRYGYWKDSESAFMKKNRDLVNDFNDLSPEEQQNKNNGIVKEMKDKYGKHITEISEEIVTKL